jgi:hypothetical protein
MRHHEDKDQEDLMNELLLPKDKPITAKQYKRNREHLEAYLQAARQLYGEEEGK